MSKYTDLIIPLFFQAGRKLARSERQGDSDSISMARRIALYYVAENKKVKMKDLAKFLGVTPPSTTALINSLVEAGLVERIAEEDDRRQIIISLTQKGKESLERDRLKISKKLNEALDNLSEIQQKQFIEILEKITK